MISTEHPDSDITLVEDDKELSFLGVHSFVDEQQWALFDYVESKPMFTSKELAFSNFKQPGLKFECGASRKPGFFVWNIFFIQVRSFPMKRRQLRSDAFGLER